MAIHCGKKSDHALMEAIVTWEGMLQGEMKAGKWEWVKIRLTSG
jgi:hypothetical protein